MSRSRDRSRSSDRRRHSKRDRKHSRSHRDRESDRKDDRRRRRRREEREEEEKRERLPSLPDFDVDMQRTLQSLQEEGAREGMPSGEEAVNKEKPNFGLSGALNEDRLTGNTKNGVVLKFAPPADARKPTSRWRLYVYKNGAQVSVLHLHALPSFLVGRSEEVADILCAHPSISSQHGVIVFRKQREDKRQFRNEAAALDGAYGGSSSSSSSSSIKPYFVDLDSTNGTFLNGERVEGSRYIQLLHGDVLRFGESSREYVVMHENEET